MIAREEETTRLEEGDIDDILYLSRVGDKEELQQALGEAETKYSATAQMVLLASAAEDSGNTALHFAAANGHADVLDYILSKLDAASRPAFANRRNAAGNTPLHWSALNGHMEATRVLIGAGADMWIRNGAGNLAVFEAERAGKDDVVAFLLKTGGADKEGESAGEQGGETTFSAGDVGGGDGVEETTVELASSSLED